MSFTLPLLLPSLSQMDKLLDMKEFGEAAPYLRKSYTEQLKLQTVPFDGKSPGLFPSLPLCHGSQESALLLKASQALQNPPSTLEGKKISLMGRAGF